MLRVKATVSALAGDQATLQLATGATLNFNNKQRRFKLGAEWNIYLDEVVSDAEVQARVRSWNRKNGR